ncbi:MAG: TIGR02996 domain-containing protein [Archangium sp.]|nr:TIGR02996 domain-containing protein [Archangium sp.]
MTNPRFDAMVKAPWEDAPRLVYADWLSENDDPRGEFIVLQCRLASGKLAPKDVKTAKAREAELLDAHREEWFGPLEKWLREHDSYALSHVKLRRGFVSSCRLTVQQPGDLATLFQKAPLLEELELRGDAVTPVPQLAQLERLDAEGEVAESLVSELATASSLARLRLWMKPARALSLDLSRCPKLESLWFDSERVTHVKLPPTLRAVRWSGDSTALVKALPANLTTLAISGAVVCEALLAVLKRCAPTLEVLALDGAKFGKGQLATVLGWAWPRLRSLDLSNVGLGLEGAKLVAAMKASQLELLDLTYTRLTDAGAVAVLSSALLETLKEVSLRANRLTVAAVAPVLMRKHGLRLLNLKKNALSAAELKGLATKLPDTRLTR